MVKHNKWYLIYGVVGLLNAKCLEQCLEQSKKYVNDHSDGGDNDIIFIIMFTPSPPRELGFLAHIGKIFGMNE